VTKVVTTLSPAKSLPWTRAMVFSALWSGWAASISVVLLATIAVEAVPDVRVIAFFPA
jgi:hypothetical protein